MNQKIHYNIQGEGKPILLIHGWAMHSGVWTDFVRDFSSMFKIITMDLRGHGKSVPMEGPYTFATFAEDVASLIFALKLKSLTLVGWSMGASILLKMFERPVPGVDSIVLISGNPSFVKRKDYKQGVSHVTVQRLSRQVNRNYKKGLLYFYGLLFTQEERAVLLNSSTFLGLADTNTVPQKQAALELLRCLEDEDLRSSLKNIQVPTLIIHGRQDRICVPDAAQYMHERISRSHILFLEDTGHVPFIIKKEEVHHAIKEFLESL
jgi:pimeloyl-[acyl-carrier protein] methyl ester esterase